MSNAWKTGSNTRWRTVVRPAVFERAGGKCQVRLEGEWTTRNGEVRRCLGIAQEVHHTRGKEAGDDMRFLVAACRPCNLKVGDPLKNPDPPCEPKNWW